MSTSQQQQTTGSGDKQTGGRGGSDKANKEFLKQSLDDENIISEFKVPTTHDGLTSKLTSKPMKTLDDLARTIGDLTKLLGNLVNALPLVTENYASEICDFLAPISGNKGMKYTAFHMDDINRHRFDTEDIEDGLKVFKVESKTPRSGIERFEEIMKDAFNMFCLCIYIFVSELEKKMEDPEQYIKQVLSKATPAAISEFNKKFRTNNFKPSGWFVFKKDTTTSNETPNKKKGGKPDEE